MHQHEEIQGGSGSFIGGDLDQDILVVIDQDGGAGGMVNIVIMKEQKPR